LSGPSSRHLDATLRWGYQDALISSDLHTALDGARDIERNSGSARCGRVDCRVTGGQARVGLLAARRRACRPLTEQAMATAYSQASSHLAAPMNRYVRNLMLTRLVVVLVARTTSCAPAQRAPSARGRRRLADKSGRSSRRPPRPEAGRVERLVSGVKAGACSGAMLAR